jgi:hypothetical protein
MVAKTESEVAGATPAAALLELERLNAEAAVLRGCNASLIGQRDRREISGSRLRFCCDRG